MIFARARLNWQIHLPDRLIPTAHERSKFSVRTGVRASNIRAVHASISRLPQPSVQQKFRHMIGDPKQSANTKKL
jgi:hypothetical protein